MCLSKPVGTDTVNGITCCGGSEFEVVEGTGGCIISHELDAAPRREINPNIGGQHLAREEAVSCKVFTPCMKQTKQEVVSFCGWKVMVHNRDVCVSPPEATVLKACIFHEIQPSIYPIPIEEPIQ
jgi:hypothetical protein